VTAAHTGRRPRNVHHCCSCAVPETTCYVQIRMPLHAGGAAEHGRHRNRASAAGPDAAGQRPVARVHRRGHPEHRDCDLCAGAPCKSTHRCLFGLMLSACHALTMIFCKSWRPGFPGAPGPSACRRAAVRKCIACDAHILSCTLQTGRLRKFAAATRSKLMPVAHVADCSSIYRLRCVCLHAVVSSYIHITPLLIARADSRRPLPSRSVQGAAAALQLQPKQPRQRSAVSGMHGRLDALCFPVIGFAQERSVRESDQM